MKWLGLSELDGRGAILVGAGEERYMAELGRLAETLGIESLGVLEQRRRDGSGYLGKGKRAELSEMVSVTGASFVITDDELTASQARVLERDCGGASVVDRTELIIHIFEAHARDRASRLEVELADLEYRLPRVKGRNPELSRLAGGVGGGRITRGPGEQQLEYERRTIRERIDTINRRLSEERESRRVRGSRLSKGGPPRVVLLGYTNAGKTTVLNALSRAGRSTRDWLFETLETTTRLVEGESNKPGFVVTDTVGFIRKLPTQLVHSFASTLEAARDADVRVLCADASSPDLESEIETVRDTLSRQLNAENKRNSDNTPSPGKPEDIICLNKVDLITDEELAKLGGRYEGAVMISALKNAGDLLTEIQRQIASRGKRFEILIPHSEYGETSYLYERAEIHASRNDSEGVWMDVTIPDQAVRKYSRYRV